MNLLCDHMLGSLATWLRIFGYDTFYPNEMMNDEDILQVARNEKRLLLSRDHALLLQAKKELIPILEIQTTDLAEQLRLVLQKIPPDETLFLTRCTLCNTLLHLVPKEELKNKIPEKIYQTQDTFWVCPTCKKYYWMGTHYHHMKERINTLRNNHSS